MNDPARPLPRIMFIVNSLAGGGAERALLTLLEASRERLGTVADFRLALLDDDPRDHAPPDWLPVEQLDCHHSLPRSIVGLFRLCKAWRPDATVSFLTRANIASTIVARMVGHRAIVSERADTATHFDGKGLAGAGARTLVRLFYPHADRIVAVSEGVARGLEANFGIPAEKISTIANPVSCESVVEMATAAPSIAVDQPYAVTVSRLTRSKNVALLIKALAGSAEPLKLVVIGQGSDEGRLKALASKLGISHRVTFAGFQQNPHAITSRAAFYVSGSNSEGFPNAHVEALALGVPVLATNCASGPSEILDDRMRENVDGLTLGRWGILVPPGDIEVMTAGMKAIRDPDAQARYRAAGPTRARAFDATEMSRRYWQLIETVLTGTAI